MRFTARECSVLEKLDTFDWKILSVLQRDCHRTGEQLSAEVGLSAAACLRRVQRLRKIGAIEKEVAVVSRKYLPGQTQVIVRMTVGRNNPQKMNELGDRLRRQGEVERIFAVTGDDDLVMIVRCESMEHFTDFIEAHLYDPPVEFVSLVVLREYETLGAEPPEI